MVDGWYKKLTPGEKAIILKLLKVYYSPKYGSLAPGALPFVNQDDIEDLLVFLQKYAFRDSIVSIYDKVIARPLNPPHPVVADPTHKQNEQTKQRRKSDRILRETQRADCNPTPRTAVKSMRK